MIFSTFILESPPHIIISVTEKVRQIMKERSSSQILRVKESLEKNLYRRTPGTDFVQTPAL